MLETGFVRFCRCGFLKKTLWGCAPGPPGGGLTGAPAVFLGDYETSIGYKASTYPLWPWPIDGSASPPA